MADVTIYGQGFYAITGETKRGKAFVKRCWGGEHGQTYCDDSRLAQDIADGAVLAGLRVVVNGARYTRVDIKGGQHV